MPGTPILIIHQGAIGDLVLSLPALQTIKNSFPGHAIEMLGYPGILSLVSGNFADTIHSVDWAPASTLYGDCEFVSEQMRQYLAGFERIFIFSSQTRSVFISNVQRCHPAVVCIRTFPSTVQHVIDYQLSQLAAMGFEPSVSIPQLFVSPADRSRADEFLRQNYFDSTVGPVIAVHPGSGGRHKNWPVASFIALMQAIHVKLQASFLIISGPADENTAREMQAGVHNMPHRVLRDLDLSLVAALISRCSLFIGNDSGMTHIAAAAGIPTVAVFGPTDPAVWAPRGPLVRIVSQLDESGQWIWPEPEALLHEVLQLEGE